VYSLLLDHYGPQHWWPAETPFEVVVGAILTQSTAWSNVSRAIANLKAAGVLSADAILALPQEELETLIRPSGYYRVKARKLRTFLEVLARDTAAASIESSLYHTRSARTPARHLRHRPGNRRFHRPLRRGTRCS
jgi:endonuclease III-like uncharacterized protein